MPTAPHLAVSPEGIRSACLLDETRLAGRGSKGALVGVAFVLGPLLIGHSPRRVHMDEHVYCLRRITLYGSPRGDSVRTQPPWWTSPGSSSPYRQPAIELIGWGTTWQQQPSVCNPHSSTYTSRPSRRWTQRGASSSRCAKHPKNADVSHARRICQLCAARELGRCAPVLRCGVTYRPLKGSMASPTPRWTL